jgi:hypothetical protein
MNQDIKSPKFDTDEAKIAHRRYMKELFKLHPTCQKTDCKEASEYAYSPDGVEWLVLCQPHFVEARAARNSDRLVVNNTRMIVDQS